MDNNDIFSQNNPQQGVNNLLTQDYNPSAQPVYPAQDTLSQNPQPQNPYAQTLYTQPDQTQPDFSMPAYSQSDFSQPNYPQPDFSQPGYSQPDFMQQGIPNEGLPQQSFPQDLSQPAYSQVPPTPSFNYTPEEEISLGDWVLTITLSVLPCVGFVMLLVWAFGSSETPKTKQNWARAMLILMLIGFILSILFTASIGAVIIRGLRWLSSI